jgi:hypothetical protein
MSRSCPNAPTLALAAPTSSCQVSTVASSVFARIGQQAKTGVIETYHAPSCMCSPGEQRLRRSLAPKKTRLAALHTLATLLADVLYTPSRASPPIP